jgi:hypothetical protein
MNEAQQMHADLLPALQLLIPRMTYQDPRRLNTLAWDITSLYLMHILRLSAWAEVVESRATLASSRVRRFSRWLHHPAIAPSQWHRPVDQRLYIALDTTVLFPFVLIHASLVYRGRALPLAWRAMLHQSTQVSFQVYQPTLKQVHALLPAGQLVTLLADRGFAHEHLLHYLQQLRWHFRLRLPGDTLVHLRACWVAAVKALCPAAGRARFLQQVALFGTVFGPASHARAPPLLDPDDPWRVVSSEPATLGTLQEYRLRFGSSHSRRKHCQGPANGCVNLAFSNAYEICRPVRENAPHY